MAVGAIVRALCGRHEHKVADLYRSIFVSLDDYAALVRDWVPQANRILEVGCGEGAVTERLAALYPAADIVAIDISPRAGRLYRGRKEGVRFETVTVEEIAGRMPGTFDLVILSDVIHHVPDQFRSSLLSAIGDSMAPGGRFIVKDWSPSATPIHWLCHMADRWITGDRVDHMSAAALRTAVEDRIPAAHMLANGQVRPWKSNFAFLFGT